MESTASVSKGVFLFGNGFRKDSLSKKISKPLFEKLFPKELWYITFKRVWNNVECELKDLDHRTYSLLFNDIVSYIKTFDCGNEQVTPEGIIPSATLLTGVNQPDHISLFSALIEKIRSEVSPHIAMVNSQDASTLKHLVENAVWQLMHAQETLDNLDNEDEEMLEETKRLRKNQCTMRTLLKWYTSPKKNKYLKKSLLIIIPDFESFNCNILQDFVMIVSSYTSYLPIVLVFGVATSVSALHKSFPYHVSSKLLTKVFHSHSSPIYMNQVLEDIFLSHHKPLHLSGKVFELLTDVFLFYDFSVCSLVQSIKYCMMEHYYGDNTKALCCERDKIEEALQNLTAEDLENIRKLHSFRPYVESQDCQTRINLLLDDNFLRSILNNELNKFHDYLYSFFVCVRLLTAFVRGLPTNPLGKTMREIYAKCTVNLITDSDSYKECMLLLGFQSQVRLAETIKSALNVINSTMQNFSPEKLLTPSKSNLNNIQLDTAIGEGFVESVQVHLMIFLRQIENANTEATVVTKSLENIENDMLTVPGNRHELKEKLLQSMQVEKVQSEFEMVRARFISYLEEMFGKGLLPPHRLPFHELMVFSDVPAVKKQIVGAPRGAIHTALSNPQHYLKCTCCHLPTNESTVATLPDVSLAYKLHLECGKHINLYDWLQAFAAVLRPEDKDKDDRHHDPSVVARFTQAVDELQFLGFIKSSKRKTDHVERTTW